MVQALPVRKAEYSLVRGGGRVIGAVLLDPASDILHSRFRDDVEDGVLLEWAGELPGLAAELGGRAYYELLLDRLSNAAEITDPEHVAVRDFDSALDRIFDRLVLGSARERGGGWRVPLYTARVAAGTFGADMEVEQEASIEAPAGLRPSKDMFAVHVTGRSMEPEIPEGSVAVFRRFAGSRQNKRVVVQQLATSSGGGEFTVKVYTSTKRRNEESWEHESIVLLPLNPEYDPVVLDPDDSRYEVLGELVTVLGFEDLL